nr:hypothetical protein [Parageobacillus galactosidasius]
MEKQMKAWIQTIRTDRQGISFVVELVGTLPLPTTWLRKTSAGLLSTSRTRQPIRLVASPRL